MHTHGCLISTATGVVMSLLGVLLLYVGLFVWPVAFALTAWIKRWRRAAAVLAVHAISYSAVWLLMFATPSQFRYWWWD